MKILSGGRLSPNFIVVHHYFRLVFHFSHDRSPCCIPLQDKDHLTSRKRIDSLQTLVTIIQFILTSMSDVIALSPTNGLHHIVQWLGFHSSDIPSPFQFCNHVIHISDLDQRSERNGKLHLTQVVLNFILLYMRNTH